MYQGHKTKEDYIKAWKVHAKELWFMYVDTAGTDPNQSNAFTNPTAFADSRLAQIHEDIERAADNLEAAGKFGGES